MALTMERAKNSVGLTNFVEFYEDYWAFYKIHKTARSEVKKNLAEKLLSSNPNASSIVAQNTRINYTVEIFKNNWQEQILKVVIDSDNSKIKQQTKKKAILLLTKMESGI